MIYLANNDLMKKTVTQFSLLLMIFLGCCEQPWGDHYITDESYVDRSVWDEIEMNPEYLKYKDYLKELELENFFLNTDSTFTVKTVFIPSNTAWQSYEDGNGEISEGLMLYHLIESLFLLANIDGNVKSLAQNTKYLYFEEKDDSYYVDGIELNPFPQRFSDGIIYPINEVLLPKPSIAEYLNENAEYFESYINSFDTIIMDYSQSEIIEIDVENDLVIYDSVYTIYNEFKETFFNVSHNTRDLFATLLLYTDEQFYDALDVVAEDLGYPSGKDLPVKWITEVYFEYYLKTAFFDGIKTYNDFTGDFVINILGDTVKVDYENLNPDPVICSNGLIYHYYGLVIPESLYKSEASAEGEALVFRDIYGNLSFGENVSYIYRDPSGGNLDLTGNLQYVLGAEGIASNDSALQISIASDFTGTFELEVRIPNVFPGRYFLDWAGFSTVSGLYRVYINDSLLSTRLPFEPALSPGDLLTEFDSYNFGNFTLDDISAHENGIDWTKLRASNSSWNINEFYVERDPTDPDEYYLKEFGDVIVKFEFVNSSPENNKSTGIVIDYLRLRKR